MQIKRGYAEGGFLDDGAVVDDVSGNEVPTGSLEAEVRDDIPAQLSEGEFVLPADVVRFIGLDKLMKMRKAAKAGLADMEEEGQIGGSPTPAMEGEMELMGMDNESMEMDALIDGMDGESFEGDAQHFAQGGSVRAGYKKGGAAKVLPTHAQYIGEGETNGIKVVQYTNDAGDTINIRVLRGNPQEPVPEGYYPVGEKPDVPDAPDVPKDSVVGSGVDERSANYKKSGKYAAELAKSEQIRRGRVAVLDGMHKSNMTQQEVDTFFEALTPDAREEFDNRFRDPKYLDSYLTEGKSPVELMIIAQKTVNSKHRQAGTIEEGSGYTADGKPIDWDGLGDFLKKAALGTLDFSAVGAKSILTTLFDKFSSKKASVAASPFEQDLEGKATGNNKQPAKVEEPITYDQAHWRKRIGELGGEGLSASEIQTELRKEQRSAEFTTKRNAYGHKIYKDPGTRTVWDDIADVQANSLAAIEANRERANPKDPVGSATLTAPVTEKTPATVVKPTVKTPAGEVQPVVSGEGPRNQYVASPIQGEGPRNQYSGVYPEVVPEAIAQDVNSQDPKLLKQMGVGVTEGNVQVTPAPDHNNAIVGSTAFEQLIKKTPEERLADMAQEQYDTQLEVQTAENEDFYKVMRELDLAQTVSDEDYYQYSLDKKAANEDPLAHPANDDAWAKFVAQQNSKPTVGARKDRMIKQVDEWGIEAKATAAQRNADRLAYLASQATKGSSSEQDKESSSEQDKESAARAMAKAKAKNVADAAEKEDHYVGGQYGLAAGGLASKKKPAIKKMRKDSTSGLAAKKKSKERAKAKKGALAAKRT